MQLVKVNTNLSESAIYATFLNTEYLHISLKMSTFVTVMKDLKDIEIHRLRGEIVRLNNELSRERANARFFMDENKSIAEETREECKSEYEFRISIVTRERDEANARAAEAENKAQDAEKKASVAESKLTEATKTNIELTAKLAALEGAQKVADEAKKANVDYKSIINLIQRREFNRNSDATRFLDGVIDPNDPRMEERGFEDVVKHIMELTNDDSDSSKSGKAQSSKEKQKKVELPKQTQDKKSGKTRISTKKRCWTATELKQYGIDPTVMPQNSRIVKRRNTKTGLDIWIVQTIAYQNPRVILSEYEVARIYTPGKGMDNTKRPKTIVEGCPVLPSFARFYFDSKIALNLSENRILEMLETMHTKIPQETLNYWMHQIMQVLRENLQQLMIEGVKRSVFTHNDETRILVRSRKRKDEPFKYNMEYIHAALSLQEKLVVMLYKDGSRDHKVQEEALFKDSSIRCFLADRAPLYEAIVGDLEEYYIERAACWFYARHYLVDAYIGDSRVYDIIEYINYLFYIEKESAKRKYSPEQRLRFRLRYSQPIVTRIMKRLEEIHLAGDEYGELVHRAVNYILGDKEAFQKFLQNGNIELSNNAIERCFRHIAIGRRNWLHTGSHFAAENIAFMYSLLESCKLNKINFGEYIEDILTRFMNGEKADESFLPNHYVARPKEKQKAA